MAKNNRPKDFNIKTFEKLYEEALTKVSDKDWQNAIRHVMELENSNWKKKNICDIDIEQVLVNLCEDSSSSDSSED